MKGLLLQFNPSVTKNYVEYIFAQSLLELIEMG